jgi:iron complex transport system ATP-binding protein
MLTTNKISVTYGERAVLRDVSFELASGEVVALLGANGAGKTTLIKALNRSVEADAGDITYKGRPLSSLSRREIAQNIAVVAQENETRFPITFWPGDSSAAAHLAGKAKRTSRMRNEPSPTAIWADTKRD